MNHLLLQLIVCLLAKTCRTHILSSIQAVLVETKTGCSTKEWIHISHMSVAFSSRLKLEVTPVPVGLLLVWYLRFSVIFLCPRNVFVSFNAGTASR